MPPTELLRRVRSPALRLKPNLLLWGNPYEAMWWRTHKAERYSTR